MSTSAVNTGIRMIFHTMDLRPSVSARICLAPRRTPAYIQMRSVRLIFPEHRKRPFRSPLLCEDIDLLLSMVSGTGLLCPDYAADLPGAELSWDRFLEKIDHFEYSAPKIEDISSHLAFNVSYWSKSPLYVCVKCVERTCEVYKNRVESRGIPLVICKGRRDHLIKIISRAIEPLR